MGKALEKFASIGVMIPIKSERENDADKKYIKDKYSKMSKEEKSEKKKKAEGTGAVVGGITAGAVGGVGAAASIEADNSHNKTKTKEGIKAEAKKKTNKAKAFFGNDFTADGIAREAKEKLKNAKPEISKAKKYGKAGLIAAGLTGVGTLAGKAIGSKYEKSRQES